MPAATGVSVVIPTWNGKHLLGEFLPAVETAAGEYARLSGEPVEIVVVDDGSTDGTGEWLHSRAAHPPVALRVVALEENRGFGAACNAGARAATYRRMLLLNNDVAIELHAIAPLVAQFDGPSPLGPLFAVHCRTKDIVTDEDVGTGKIGGFHRGFLRVHRSFVAGDRAARPLPSIFANAGAALFDRQRFLDIGGFDLLFAPFYFEDVEIGYRAWKRGWVVGYEPRSVVRHRFSSTISRFGKRRIQTVSHRNRLLLHWIHLTDRRWFWQHLGWVAVLAAWSCLSFRFTFARGLWLALGQRDAVRSRRRESRRAAVRSDRDVVAIFRQLEQRDDVFAYDTTSELKTANNQQPTTSNGN
jgi:GT2 family glycosyltransferase